MLSAIKGQSLQFMPLEFEKGLAVITEGGKQGVINTLGGVIIPLGYQGVEILSNGLIKIYKDSKDFSGINYLDNWHSSGSIRGIFRLFNNQGQILHPADFNFIGNFEDDLAIVNVGGEYIYTCYDYGEYENEEIRGGKFGIIDCNGYLRAGIDYDSIEKVNVNIFLVKRDDRFFFINERGSVLSEDTYDYAGVFDNGYPRINDRQLDLKFKLPDFLVVKNNDKLGLLDKNANPVFQIKYDDIVYMPGTHNFICYDGSFALYSIQGKLLSKKNFLDIRVLFFDREVIAETISVFDGFDIDKYSEECYCSKYTKYLRLKPSIDENVIGLKLLTENGWVFYDSVNNQLYEKAFQNIFLMQKSTLLVIEKDKYGLVSTRCETILSSKYDEIFIKGINLFRVKKEGEIGEINQNGEIVTPFETGADLDDRVWTLGGY